MADLHEKIPASGKRRAGRCPHRSRIQTDLTPMVDLGFLLIAFFVMTTTMAKPHIMSVSMPHKPKDGQAITKWPEGTTATVLLGKNHRLHYYEGAEVPKTTAGLINAGFKGGTTVRDLILQKKSAVAELKAKGIIGLQCEAAFLIKPGIESTYGDFVDMLDELHITGISMKAVVDISPDEAKLLQDAEAQRQ